MFFLYFLSFRYFYLGPEVVKVIFFNFYFCLPFSPSFDIIDLLNSFLSHVNDFSCFNNGCYFHHLFSSIFLSLSILINLPKQESFSYSFSSFLVWNVLLFFASFSFSSVIIFICFFALLYLIFLFIFLQSHSFNLFYCF